MRERRIARVGGGCKAVENWYRGERRRQGTRRARRFAEEEER
jgi:hypothetical protein